MVAMLTAIGLDLGFRIGVARRAESILTATGDPALPYAFMEHHGAAWGARRDVVGRVTAAIVAFREHMGELLPPDGTARMAVRYDEFAIDLVFRWVGAAPALPRPGKPDPDSLLRADPDEAAEIGRAAGRVRGCQVVEISVVAVDLKKTKTNITNSIHEITKN